MAFSVRLGGSGITYQPPSNLSLAAGEQFIIPSGTYVAAPGPFTFLQWFDSTSGLWRSITNQAGRPSLINSDGANWRLANLTGCAVGAVVTTAGSAYVAASPPTVTA